MPSAATIEIKVGDEVELPRRHWLRAGQRGICIADDGHRYLICFRNQFDGGGISVDGGQGLWLEGIDLRKSNPIQKKPTEF